MLALYHLVASSIIVLAFFSKTQYSSGYTTVSSTPPSATPSITRRTLCRYGIASTISVLTNPGKASGAPKQESSNNSPQEDIVVIKEAGEVLTTLLQNWDRATIVCIYADVPRELLETKNKQQLLEKASTFALFDKSTSVVSCKKSNKIVRDYLGLTAKGPMVNIEKRMLKRTVADSIDPDCLDKYYSEIELFSQAISDASTLSYAAGLDLDSMNNFAKDEKKSVSLTSSNMPAIVDSSNLEGAKKSIVDAKISMDKILSLLVV